MADERSLDSYFTNESRFAFLEIVCHRKSHESQRMVADGQITWRLIQNDEGGALAESSWGIDTYTNFLIDSQGVVRAVNLFEPLELKAQISELIAELEPAN